MGKEFYMDESFYSSNRNRVYRGGIGDFVTKSSSSNLQFDQIEYPDFGRHITLEDIRDWYASSLKTLMEIESLQDLCYQFENLRTHILKIKQELDFLHLEDLLSTSLIFDSLQYEISTDGIREIAQGSASDEILLSIFQNALNQEYSFVKRFEVSR